MCIRTSWDISRIICRPDQETPHLIETAIHGRQRWRRRVACKPLLNRSSVQTNAEVCVLISQTHSLGRKYYWFPLDVARRSGIVRSCSVHISFTKSSGGTHG